MNYRKLCHALRQLRLVQSLCREFCENWELSLFQNRSPLSKKTVSALRPSKVCQLAVLATRSQEAKLRSLKDEVHEERPCGSTMANLPMAKCCISSKCVWSESQLRRNGLPTVPWLGCSGPTRWTNWISWKMSLKIWGKCSVSAWHFSEIYYP